jgi:uncharacterized protein with PIN domain
MPDLPSPATSTPRCERCQSELQFIAAIPKRYDTPPCEIFRCPQCDEVRWFDRK